MSKVSKRQELIESGSDIEDEQDYDLDELQAMEDMEMDAMEDDASLFWSMKLEAGAEQLIEQPHIPGYMINITNACFGPEIEKNTRTLVMIETGQDEEAVPICILSAKQENIKLDLMINGMFH